VTNSAKPPATSPSSAGMAAALSYASADDAVSTSAIKFSTASGSSSAARPTSTNKDDPSPASAVRASVPALAGLVAAAVGWSVLLT
jgi:hypothetical protein